MRAWTALPLLAAAVLMAGLASAQAPRRPPGQVAPSSLPLLPAPERTQLPKEGGAIDRLSGKEVSGAHCAVGTTPGCPPPPPPGLEVFPSKPAPNTQYGFVVAIYYREADGSRRMCTGTMLTPRLVLTAAHCGCGVRGSYTVDYRQDTRDGDANRYANVDGSPILFDQRVCFDGDLSGGRDLALLRVRDPLDPTPWSTAGYPADLIWNLRAALPQGKRLTAVGYGYTEQGQIGVRMQGTIPIASAVCTEPNFAWFCEPFAEMILAEGAGPSIPADTCGGDSGGPIFLMENDRPKLVAVTSRPAPGVHTVTTHHCGGGGIYTLIGRRTVHEWLRANGVPEANIADSRPGAPAKP